MSLSLLIAISTGKRTFTVDQFPDLALIGFLYHHPAALPDTVTALQTRPANPICRLQAHGDSVRP